MNRKVLPDAAPLSVAALFCLLSGCSPHEGSASEATAEPAARATAGTVPEPQGATGRFVGNVVETMDAAGYTYALLDRDGEQVWAAGPKTALRTGDEIAIALEMPMRDFHSESLDRTFETIYFVGSLGAEDPDSGHRDPHAGLPQFRTNTEDGRIAPGAVEKAEGGYRVAELWERRAELAGKEVLVRGRVVKYNAGILGRNWLHIQDGSGDPKTGDHDLTVTTQGSSKLGDLVTVRGVVTLDRDFGAGYAYEIIVEEATVEVE